MWQITGGSRCTPETEPWRNLIANSAGAGSMCAAATRNVEIEISSLGRKREAHSCTLNERKAAIHQLMEGRWLIGRILLSESSLARGDDLPIQAQFPSVNT